MEELAALPLGYSPTWGSDALRAAIARPTRPSTPDDVLEFAGAEEAMFWALQELVGPGDHAVVTVPNYQSMEALPRATGAAVSGLSLRPEDGWALDLDALAALIRPDTRLVAVNFPNNPTGALPDPAPGRRSSRCARSAGSGCSPTRSTAGWSRTGRAPLRQAADALPDRAVARRDVEGVRAARAADRLDRLPRPRGAGAGWRRASTTRRSATPARAS